MFNLQINESNLVVLAGYLISTSAHLYTTVGTGKGNQNFLWIFGLSFILMVYFVGFLTYFHSQKCSFELQIAEYILLPLSGFFGLQAINYYRNEGFQNTKIQIASIFLIFALIQSLAFLKIYLINQTFFSEKNKNILRFQIIGRFFRICKNILACVFLVLIPQKDYFTSVIGINCFDFLLNCSKITFIKLEQQEILGLANINNVISVIIMACFGQQQKSISFLWLLIVQITLFSSNLYCNNFISSKIMEMKLTMNFNKTDVKSTLLQQKSKIVFLLSCFQSLFEFDKNEKLVLKSESSKKWSESFLLQIKTNYSYALIAYLAQLNEQNQIVKYYSCLQSKPQTQQTRKVRSIKNLFQTKGQLTLQTAYQKVFGVKLNQQQILQSKRILFLFLGFCIDKYQIKENPTLSWSYSSQFFQIFTIGIAQNFMLKQTQIFYRRQNFANDSIFFKARSKKFYDCIKHSQINYQVGLSLDEEYMLFQDQFDQLKDKMILACEDELNFLKRLTSQTNGRSNPFDIQDNLARRKQNKKQISKMIQKCTQNPHSVNCSNFAYIFLLFMVGVEKSIFKTSNLINKYFRVPLKSKKRPKEELQVLNNKSLSQNPVVVCSAFTMNYCQMGELKMFNSEFKKKFGININQFQHLRKKITDLLPIFEQKALHELAMNKQNQFQFEGQQNIKGLKFHDSLTCFLKINQEKQNFHILQPWKVAIKVFYNYESQFSYVCTLEQIGHDSFLLESDFEKLPIYQKSIIELGPESRSSQFQFGSIMKLVKVDLDELVLLGLFRNSHFLDENQQNIMSEREQEREFDLTKAQLRFMKVQDSISKQFVSYFNLKVIFSIILICAVQALTIYLIFQGDQMATEARNKSLQIEKYVSGPQSCQIKIAQSFFFLKTASENPLWNYLFSLAIPNFRDHMFNSIKNCTSGKKTDYFKKFMNENIKSTPMFEPEKLKQALSPSDLQSNSQLDFSNIMYQFSTQSDWFLSKNLAKLSADQKLEFSSFMKILNMPYEETISYNFLNYTVTQNQKEILNIQFNYRLLFLSITSINCVLFVVGVAFLIWAFITVYEEYELFWKLDSLYFDRQIQKIQVVIQQIQKTRKFQFKKCEFTAKNYFRYESKNLSESIEAYLSVTDFGNSISQIHNHQKETHVSLKKSNSGEFKSIIFGKKYIFGALLAILILHFSFSVAIWKQNNQIILNGKNVNNILGQAGITKITLPALQLSTWMILLKQVSYQPLSQTELILKKSYEFLKEQSFYLLFYGIQDTSLLNQTLYLSVCQVMEANSLMDKTSCSSLLGVLSSIRVSELLSIVTDRFNRLIPIINVNLTYSIQTLALLFNVNYRFMVPSLVGLIQMVIAKIDMKNHLRIAEFKNQYLIIITVSMFFFFLELTANLIKRRNLKGEVLTMDTLENLDKNEHFKPVINKLYNWSFY